MIKIIDGSLYQWDTGRYVTITVKNGESISEVHCYNRGDKEALVVETRFKDSSIVAPIPNILLQSARELIVCVMRENVNGEQTEEKASFHIIERAKPSDYVYTETEVKRWEDLEKRVNDTLANWETDAIDRVSEAALEAATKAFNDELAALKKADKDNGTALSNLSTEYEKSLTELQETDEDNATAIRELTETYNFKVEELEKADAENKKAIEDHIKAYNKKVIELDTKSNNASLAASNAQSSAVAAQTAATNAQNSANEAQKTANNAVEAANAAQGTANNALGIVNKAHDKAVEAQNTIDEHKNAYDGKVAELEAADKTNAEKLDEEIARAKAAEKANSDAIELLTNGISVEEIDSVKDLIKYTNDHGAEVIQMQNDISSNKKAIEETSTELAEHKSAYNKKTAAIDALNANQQNYLDYLNGVESEGLEIQINEEELSAKVVGIGTFRGENLVVPSYYQGFPVTTIGEQAFYYGQPYAPKHIKLPDTVTHIAQGAFQENSAIEEVVLPQNLRHIESSAFEAFYGKSLIIPKSVEIIKGYAFMSSNVTLYIEAESKPDGWANDWDEMHSGDVIWGYIPNLEGVNKKLATLEEANEANANALEEYKAAFNLENGAGEGSVQIKGGNAKGKSSVDFSQALVNHYFKHTVVNEGTFVGKIELFEKRIDVESGTYSKIAFDDGSYIYTDDNGITTYHASDGSIVASTEWMLPGETIVVLENIALQIISIEEGSFWNDEEQSFNGFNSVTVGTAILYGLKEETGALADNTFTAGIGTKATIKGQTALGTFNEVDDDALVMFGCGTEDAPENAVKIMKDGSVWVKADLSQLTSGSVLTIVDGILKAQPFGVGNAKHSFVVRDSGMRSTIQTPASGNSGAYQIANRIYVDKKVGGSTSISISAGGSKVIKLSCTDHEGSRTDIPRGLYNGTGIYVIYSNSSSTIEIINEKGEAVEVNGKFILLSVTPHSTTDAGIRVCALYYNSIVDVGWKTAYTVLGKTITIKAASDTTAMVQYHQISPFRTDFPT